jgi:hypothetical protein
LHHDHGHDHTSRDFATALNVALVVEHPTLQVELGKGVCALEPETVV